MSSDTRNRLARVIRGALRLLRAMADTALRLWRTDESIETLERRRYEVSGRAIRKGLELLEHAHPQRRAELTLQYGALFEHVLPGITERLWEAAALLGLVDPLPHSSDINAAATPRENAPDDR